MITSILDNDLYKFTMQNAAMKLYPHAKVKYKFINRGKHKFPEDFKENLEIEIRRMCDLFLTSDEEKYLSEKCYFLDPVYLNFLKGYRYDPNELKVIQKGNDVSVEAEGYWFRTILWEVPLLALISELYYKLTKQTEVSLKELNNINISKAVKFEKLGAKFADFGTRRRYSYANHRNVIEAFKHNASSSFIGTSNVHFAHSFELTPIGTQAHEWFMFHAAKYGFKMANSISLGRWVDIYHGNLGIALSDTFTTEAFLEVFDTMYAKLFDGVRQDSGDPIEFARSLIDHYRKLRINPKSKTIVFSDGLNYDIVEKIEKEIKNSINTSYGIGTYLSNDIPDISPLNIVIKMISAAPLGDDWAATIKLSDDKGKNSGNKKIIDLAKQVLGLRELE